MAAKLASAPKPVRTMLASCLNPETPPSRHDLVVDVRNATYKKPRRDVVVPQGFATEENARRMLAEFPEALGMYDAGNLEVLFAHLEGFPAWFAAFANPHISPDAVEIWQNFNNIILSDRKNLLFKLSSWQMLFIFWSDNLMATNIDISPKNLGKMTEFIANKAIFDMKLFFSSTIEAVDRMARPTFMPPFYLRTDIDPGVWIESELSVFLEDMMRFFLSDEIGRSILDSSSLGQPALALGKLTIGTHFLIVPLFHHLHNALKSFDGSNTIDYFSPGTYHLAEIFGMYVEKSRLGYMAIADVIAFLRRLQRRYSLPDFVTPFDATIL